MNAAIDLPQDDPRTALRRAAYWLLIVSSAGGMLGRILTVASPTGDSPFLSANDRSRWCAVRSLVDEGHHEIDRVIEDRDPKTKRRHWRTIDMVQHKGRDGRQHYYSSKPPLFHTLLAGEYWLIQRATGATFREEAFYVARWMLVITNLMPMMLYLLLLARLVERHGSTDWGRVFVVAAAAGGTFLTTFAVTLNNHTPAAVCALLAVSAALPIWSRGERRWPFFATTGLFSALTAVNELPALALVGLLGASLFWKSPARTLAAFCPPVVLVAAAFFGVNHMAHNSWRPPYSHRGDGPVLATLDASLAEGLADGPMAPALRSQFAKEGIELSTDALATTRQPGQRWELWDPERQDRFAVVRSNQRLLVRAWDNWYEYEGSYWRPENKRGVDRGEPRAGVYALHVLVGHHGVFSLTPIWLMSVLGAGMLVLRRNDQLRPLALLAAVLTIVCLAFYLTRPLVDRNYGGVACGFRWMFWFTPLWLICLLPAADAASTRRWRRALALALLLVSVASASYALMNPWSHPWLFDYWQYLGLVQY